MAESRSVFRLEQVSCDLCGGTATTEAARPVWYLPVSSDDIKVVKCTACGLVYLNPRPTQQCITGLYSQYYATGGIAQETSAVRGAVRKNLLVRRVWNWYCGQYLAEVLNKAHGSALDIGCGTGELLEDLSNRGCRVQGVEINPESARICRDKGFDVGNDDFDTVSFPEHSFDTVTMWHVIEHLPSPRRTLEKTARMLRPGGKLFIYCPNVNSYIAGWFGGCWYAWHLPFHFYHFSAETMRSMASLCGLKVSKIAAVSPEFLFSYSLDIHIRFSGGAFAKKVWETGLFRSLPFRMALAPVFRLFDLLLPGKGECLQVELERA